MPPDKFYRRRAAGFGCLPENKELYHQNYWIPGTPPKLIPKRQPENNLAVNSEEKACNEASTSSTLKEIKSSCVSSTVAAVKEKEQRSCDLFDLNRFPYELQDVASSGFKDSRDSTVALTHEQVTDGTPQDLDFVSSEELIKILDAWDPQLDKVPFTELLSSFNVATPPSQETANPTQQGTVESNLSLVTDSQTDRNSKEPDVRNISFPSPSLCSKLHNAISTTGDLQTTTNTTQQCVCQDGHRNAQEDLAFRMGVQNLNGQLENGNLKKRGPKQKPKRKKHRPRVVVDGKPKKPEQPVTPKPVTPKRVPSKANQSSRKRKYERKSSKENSVPEDFIGESLSKRRTDVIETSIVKSDAIVELPAKTCKRPLNFDLVNQPRDEKSAVATAASQPEPQVNECLVVSKQWETSTVNSDAIIGLPDKTCSVALNFDMANQSRDEKSAMTTATPRSETLENEYIGVGKHCREFYSFICKKTRSRRRRSSIICKKNKGRRSKRRRRLNTLFMSKVTLGPTKIPTKRKRKRSKRLPRTYTLASLTATPTYDQPAKLPFKQAGGHKEETEIIHKPEASQAVCGAKEVTEIIFEREARQNTPFSNDLEGNVMKSWAENVTDLIDAEIYMEGTEECPLKYDFSLTTNLADSEEVSRGGRFDSVTLKDPQKLREIWLGNESRSLQEVLPDQIIGSQEVLPIGSQEILLIQKTGWERTSYRGFLQEINDIAVQKIPPEHEAFWFTPQSQSRGSQEIPQEMRGIQQDCNVDAPSCTDGAIVPYQGPRKQKSAKQYRKRNLKQGFNADGALVPYQVPVKPKKLSAKVDLDVESLRMWNQLTDGKADEAEENEEWWRREREVFAGRVESFIARMHMILGDRRFKPWKGSVVDSVVGVYLTQNVSDNLSSNAYMSLAAKFPLQSTCNQTTSNGADSQESTGSNNMESIGRVYDPQGNMYYVTDPEPDRTHALTDRIQPLDPEPDRTDRIQSSDLDSGTEGRRLEEIEDRTVVKDAESDDAFCCSTEISIAFIELTRQLEILTLQDSRNATFDHGKTASNSERINESKTDNVIGMNEKRTKGKRKGEGAMLNETVKEAKRSTSRKKKNDPKPKPEDWELLRKMYSNSGEIRSSDHMDSVDWEAVRCAEIGEIAGTIQDRGQQNIIAGRIKDFLNGLVEKHNCIDLEWLRNAPPDKVKEYLLEIPGLGLKSVECVRLLSLQHIAFPVDTNVGRIAVRLGWVPIQPLPEEVQIHLLEQYPLMDSIQKYLWPRLCRFDQRTLYELHYQMITFGKVFCTKKNPHCSACPLRGECKHFASAFASARLALPAPSDKPGQSEKGMVKLNIPNGFENPPVVVNSIPISLLESNPPSEFENQANNCQPIIEEPPSPEPCTESSELESNSEDFCIGDIEDIPTIKLQEMEFKKNLQNFMEMNKIILQDSRALVSLTAEAASIPARKLKNISRLRTEHLVYVLPDDHSLLEGFERRLADDPCPYLLAIWSPGETPNSIEPPKNICNSDGSNLCNDQTCYNCNRIREEEADIVRGTVLIPCLTANRGRFPLNGTYFQVNEVFADHETSEQPINVPRRIIANLQTQTAYFGSTASNISKALDIQGIQKCFWRGFICVRGFDRRSRAPKALVERFHYIPSKKLGKQNKKSKR